MRRLLILPTTAAVLLTMAAPAALADDGAVVHRESVLTELDPSGAPGTSRVFTQVTVPKGEKVSLPGQSTASLRSLTGASSRDGDSVVFGSGLSRTVADHTADLPVEIDVTYSIDGQTVDASDVVGHDGEVAVTYVVRNLTSQPTEVTIADGDRVASKETVDVAVPFVGSLSMTLPPAFSGVSAPGAVVVGDGRGNTVVNWSLLLFSPLGSETQEVTWTADARDAVVPEALLQVIPVSPASFGSFDSTAAAYEGAVGSTRELTSGARQIDRNLKLLAAGAGKLFAGLTQLADGSAQLADGLVTARDGSGELSDGLGQARAGGAELADGLGDLDDGASQVAVGLAALDEGNSALLSGLGRLAAGAGDLSDGLDRLAAGTKELDTNTAALAAGAGTLAKGAADLQAGVTLLASTLQDPDEGLPATVGVIEQLQAAIGDGSPEPPSTVTLRGGVTSLRYGLDNPAAASVAECGLPFSSAVPNPCGVTELNAEAAEELGAIGTGIGQALSELSAVTAATGATELAEAQAILGELVLEPVDPTTAGGPVFEATRATQLIAGVVGSLTAGLTALDAGLKHPAPACDPEDPDAPCGLYDALQALKEALEASSAELTLKLGSPTTEDTLLYGAARVAGGTDAVADNLGKLRNQGTAPLAEGAADAAAGGEQLVAGASSAEGGAEQLKDGSGQLADGSATLAAGANRAAAGSSDLVDGLIKLDNGGAQLADGLVDAADGSQQIADGLASATPGGQQIADGTQRLTDEGTSVLARSVSDATASSSLQLAHVRAVAARGTDGDGLPYPTVDGAVASAVYEFELAGVGEDAGPGAAGQIGIGVLALLVAALLGSLAGGRMGRRDEEPIILDEYAEV